MQVDNLNDIEIKLITPEEAKKIYDSGKPVGSSSTRWEPSGKFYYIAKDSARNTIYVGIDNSDGHCWVEEFYTIAGCIAWLRGEMQVE